MRDLFHPLALIGLCVALFAGTVQAAAAINPQKTLLIEEERCVNPDGEGPCVSIRLSVDLTGEPWLDNLLLHQLDNERDSSGSTRSLSTGQYRERLLQQAGRWLQTGYAEIHAATQEEEPVYYSMQHLDEVTYLYQHKHLASFRQRSYLYTGGAHGMPSVGYVLVDLDQRKQLMLKDILLPGKLDALAMALRSNYQEMYPEFARDWLLQDDEQAQLEKFPLDSFVFTDEGLTFVYPRYLLGPYAAGELRVALHEYQASELLRPEYLMMY